MALAMVRLRSGHAGPLPGPAEARAYAYTLAERALAQSILSQRILGTPEKVKEQLERLRERTRADEFMVSTLVYGHENRVRVLELLAQTFGLEPRNVLSAR